jgi:hypothetical protein
MARRRAAQEQEPRIKPLYIVLGVVLLAAIVLFVLMNFVLFKSDSDDFAIPTPAPRASADAPVPAATPTPKPGDVEVFETFEGRDPFRPLVAGGGGSSAPAGQVPSVTARPTARPTAAPAGAVTVEVVSVADDGKSATVKVGSTTHTDAKPGASLSSGVKLERIDGTCVFFTRSGDAFRVCEGERVRR